jgi:NAD(P)-dependent dehydrogenase (short-subunit alcohol dehydrogenase family)
MTRELAVIHAREKIRVNSLCPGPAADRTADELSQHG